MSKEIKDYLHLYLGCKVKYQNLTGVIVGVYLTYVVIDMGQLGLVKVRPKNYDLIKLAIRNLSDMTKEEKKTVNIGNVYTDIGRTLWRVEEMRYLLSKHFDLFNLRDEGLALDSAKI